MIRPKKEEFNEYFKYYIDLVPQGELLNNLIDNQNLVVDFFKNIPTEFHDFKYEENKWSIKEILMHLIDWERILTFRALVGLRKDGKTFLPGMDENFYAKNADVSQKEMSDLIDEFLAVRESSKFLFKDQKEENLTFLATSKNGKISPKALGYIIIGHSIHHIKVINEKYLNEG